MTPSVEKVKEAFMKEFADQGLEGKTFEALALRLAELTPDVLESDLVKRLHANTCHPDYEYDSTEAAYKASYEKLPEKGKGWERNVDLDFGCTRSEPIEYQHWRRPKHYRLTDEIDVWDLPEIKLRKIEVTELLKRLRERLGDKRIAGGEPTDRFHSKYEYVHRYSEVFNSSETGLYAYSWTLEYGMEDYTQFPFKLRDYVQEGAHHKPYLVLCLEDHPFRILIDCINPDDNSWVSVQRADKNYGAWTRLHVKALLPINQAVLEQALELL